MVKLRPVAKVSFQMAMLDWLRSRRVSSSKGAKPNAIVRVTPTPFYAVSIVPGQNACGATQSQSGKRWLSAGAPRLPLPGCNAQSCGCRYAHHADRRSAERRWIDRAAMPQHFDGVERRVMRKRGRRDTDY